MYRLQLPRAGSEMPTLTWRSQGANQMKTKENRGWMLKEERCGGDNGRLTELTGRRGMAAGEGQGPGVSMTLLLMSV